MRSKIISIGSSKNAFERLQNRSAIKLADAEYILCEKIFGYVFRLPNTIDPAPVREAALLEVVRWHYVDQ